MNDLELFDLYSMIIGFIAICVLILILFKKIDFGKYVPGLICMIILFIVEVFENESYEEFFDFFEYTAFLSGAILLVMAAFLEYYKSNLKKKFRE